jgi:hypothetical protein
VLRFFLLLLLTECFTLQGSPPALQCPLRATLQHSQLSSSTVAIAICGF